MNNWKIFTIFLAAGLCSEYAFSDVLVFKNGDRITGEIKRIWDDEVTIEPEYADEFDVDLPDIAYIESDREFEIDLLNGTTVVAKFSTNADGEQIITTPIESLEVPLASILELDEIEDFYDWETHVDFSSNINKGNTDSENTKLRADGMFKHGDHRHRGEVTFLKEKIALTTTQDRELFLYDYNFLFNDPWFFTAQLTFERDPIIELDNRTILSAGVGHDIWDTPRKSLSTKLALGYQMEEISTNSTDSKVAVWTLRFRHDLIGDDMEVFHNHSITTNISGRTNTSYDTSTGISYEITDLLYATASIDYDYETEPAESALNEDISLVFGLGLEFE
jgi:putative salt-induced outer membrane protein YdiY